MVFNYKKNKLEQLKGFCAVVENKNSINDAAAKSNISATTISKQISSLEQDLGFILFNRVKNRLILNQNGKKYYKEAKKVLLDLDKIYNGKIGVNEPNVREILFKNNKVVIFLVQIKTLLSFFKRLLLKRIKKMMVKMGFKQLALILFGIFTTIHFSYEVLLRSSFLERNKEIIKNISESIIDIDRAMSKEIEANIFTLSEMIENNKCKNLDDLKRIQKKLNAGYISIWDKNGKMYLDTDEAHIKNTQAWHLFGGKFSLFDARPLFKDKNLIENVYVSPIFMSFSENVQRKQAFYYHKQSEKILEIGYDEVIIEDMMNKNLSDYILYISLSTPNGQEIIKSINQSFDVVKEFNSYEERFIVDKNGSNVVIRLPFGGIRKNYSRTGSNKRGQYFYILNAVFTTTSLKHHLWTVRIVTILSLSTFLSLIYIWNKTRIEKIERSKKRRNGRWGETQLQKKQT